MIPRQDVRRPSSGLARLSTPSLTTATSRTSSMISAPDSAFAQTTIVARRSPPPLIDLEDVMPVPPKRPLALEAGAGVTPTDKLRALLRQMESEARAARPSEPDHIPPPQSKYREHVPSTIPIRSPPSDEDVDEYSPPSPPPRIANPYLYSRRAMERRDVDDDPHSPEQPRRLPSRAIALRAATAAAAAEVQAGPSRDMAPTPLETFIASHPTATLQSVEPSTSRRHAESGPRPPSPKGKERAEYLDESEIESQADAEELSPPRRRAVLPPRHVESAYENEELQYEERSPPRRRLPLQRSIEAPDTSAAFAAGVHGLEEADELDLDDSSMVPWHDESVDSLNSGLGEEPLAEELSYSRTREFAASATPRASFATAPSSRTVRASPSPADTSLPPLPDPESSEEEDNTALRARAEMFRRSPRESLEGWSQSHNSSVSSRDRTAFTDAHSSTRQSPKELTRFESARNTSSYDSIRESVRYDGAVLEAEYDQSARSLRSQSSSRSLRDSHGHAASLRNSVSRETVQQNGDTNHSFQHPSPPRTSPKASIHQSTASSPRGVALNTSRGSPKSAFSDGDSHANGDSDAFAQQSTPESARSRRLRESREARLRNSISPPTRTSASVRWEDDETAPAVTVDASPPAARWSSDTSMQTIELSPPKEPLREMAAPSQGTNLTSTSAVSTPVRAPAPPAPKTPRLPGAWGTPLPPRAPVAKPTPETPRTPAVVPTPDLVGMPTPKPPGAWRTPAPAPATASPVTPVAPSTVGPVGPTPRPPGSWYTPTAHHRGTVPFKFSGLRNEVHPDDSMSSAGSLHDSIGDVSIHRLRPSPKRSPVRQNTTSPKTSPGVLAPVYRSPKRSPRWSPLSRPTFPVPPSPLPTTPTKSSQSQDVDFDPDMSWTTRLKRAVMSPVKRPPPSTAFTDAQSALDAASLASAQARSRVEAAQRAWASALAAVPADPQPQPMAPRVVVEVARKGYSWGVFMFWAVLELLLLWGVFRVTLDYATSTRLLAAIDPFHPQLGSYALGIPLPAALEAFATRRAGPANLFDLLDSLGLGLGLGSPPHWAPPS
ncbi:uncharacterized protein EHS24_005137 [Apiotrichum porosum]|uniref:Uncharacterized protein n=1 Tax=Apiotrichum porosum TaxID=105984 RepID=A0A427Y6Z0_9TREE|nr:uncharacterized protein EHS24_005137 [Apiotrichum porosum]RSH86859.1 hypothetical protein EHS24_005137 [Apiotrichum porosum]